MHSEHLNNLRPSTVFLGWFIAVAVTSLILFVFVRVGLLAPDDTSGTRMVVVAVTLGFAAGGLFAGFMASLAPILYGVSIGMTSLVVWVLVNGLTTLLFPKFEWEGLTADLSVSILFVQIVGAVLGARLGYRLAVRRTV